MRILLSGKTGQLGRALNATLPRLGDVVAPARADFDLTSELSMRRALDDIRPDLIVNAAAYTAVDQAESERDIAMAVNGRAPGIMAAWAAAHGAAMLHYSTDYVFDGAREEPYGEDDAPAPLNAYGESKLAGEQAVARAGAAGLIVRTSWLYDAAGSNFLRTILRLARDRPRLQIVDDQTGAPTPAWWLAEASARIVAADGAFAAGRVGILHTATAGATTWRGFAAAIVDGARDRAMPLAVETVDPIPSAAYPTRADRPKNSIFRLDRLRGEFGVTPPHWRDALARVLDEVARGESRP